MDNPVSLVNGERLAGRNLLLGICGGVAAYKSAQLVRDLQRAGATVQVVMTAAAAHFVVANKGSRPLTLDPASCPSSRQPSEQRPGRGMNYGAHPGWIEVISGVMFSGKSEELIRRVRRATIARRRVQVFKSHLDSRYTGLYSVSSHDGTELEASPVDSAARDIQAGAAGHPNHRHR